MLSDIREPQLVDAVRCELPQHEIIVNRRPCFPGEAPLFGMQRPELLLGAQPPDSPLGRGHTVVGDLVGHEPIPELRIIPVDIESEVRQMGVVPVSLGDRVASPFVESLG